MPETFSNSSSLLKPSNACCTLSSKLPERNSERLIFPQIYDSWHRGKENLKITEIQLRKEFQRPFFHEFILLRLSDGRQFRFDRRPKFGEPIDTLLHRGAEAFDTVQFVESIADKCHPPSQCIAALDLNNHVRVSLILDICFGIQSDNRTRRYTLHEFNCYFFSWTIISVVARYLVAWADLPKSVEFVQPWKNEVSKTFVIRLTQELAKLLPATLSQKFPTALSRNLVRLLPDHLAEPANKDMLFHDELSASLKSFLSAGLIEAEISSVLADQPRDIQNILTSESCCQLMERQLWDLITSRDHCIAIIVRRTLGYVLRDLFWHDGIDLAVYSILEERARRDPEGSRGFEYFVGGEEGWKLCADLLVLTLSQSIEHSKLSAIARQANRVVERVLLQHNPQYASRLEEVQASTRPAIQKILAAAILQVTQTSVHGCVRHVKKQPHITRNTVVDSTATVMKQLFPNTLPVSLRIPPSKRNNKLRQLIWLFQPESALYIWKSRYQLQSCENLTHQRLQAYIKTRIRVHSQDVALFRRTSAVEIQDNICGAIDQVWRGMSSIREKPTAGDQPTGSLAQKVLALLG
ncbi:hypothetical protein FS749_007254 [Ceratobasidium sp. UAMH 11750]|nr:hypothetical protein FS749_007254 [Ceratobasidium sp. UAMH 11750]